MRILLVRHTAAEIAPGLCYGRLDIPLSADGQAKAARVARSLRQVAIAQVYSSPAKRCRILAEAISSAPSIDLRLQELDFGLWEGQAWDTIDRTALDAWAADPAGFAPPGGETGMALLRRIGSFAETMLSIGQDAIVIAHGGPLRVLPDLLRRRPADLLAPAPCCGEIVAIDLGVTDRPHPPLPTAPPPPK